MFAVGSKGDTFSDKRQKETKELAKAKEKGETMKFLSL